MLQEINDMIPLEVHQDGATGLAPHLGPVVAPQDPWRWLVRDRTSADQAKDSGCAPC